MSLWICEKPDQAKNFANAIGVKARKDGYIELANGDKITWCIGHLLEASKPNELKDEWKSWSLDVMPITPRDLKNKPKAAVAKQFNVVKRLVNEANNVIIATDADREGTLIAREILDYCHFRGTVDRVLPLGLDRASLNKLLKEFENTRANSGEKDMPDYYEAKARELVDYWVGMTHTITVTNTIKPAGLKFLVHGGVVTPLTKLIVDREKEIKEFKPEDYYHITADLKVGNHNITLTHTPREMIKDKAFAEKIKQAVENWQGELKVEKKEVNICPPKLFSLSYLSAKTPWEPSKTLSVVQSLYDKGILTYPRSDSQLLPRAQVGLAKPILANLAKLNQYESLKPFVENPNLRFGIRYKDDPSSSHHAIVPTTQYPDLSKMSSDEKLVFNIVAKNFAANHMNDGVNNQVKVSFNVNVDGKDIEFSVTGSSIKEIGWRAIYGVELDEREAKGEETDRLNKFDNEDGEISNLPNIDNGAKAKTTKSGILSKVTKPPKRYKIKELPIAMGKLINEIDDPKLKAALKTENPDKPKGLGTEATRPAMIAKIKDLKYISEKKGEAVPTEKAFYLVEGLDKYCSELSSPVTRAEFEFELGKIGKSTSPKQAYVVFNEFLDKSEKLIKEQVKILANNAKPVTLPDYLKSTEYVTEGISTKQAKAISMIAKTNKLKLKRDWKNDAAYCREIFEQYKLAPPEERTPSKSQIDYLNSMYDRLKIEEKDRSKVENAAEAKKLIDKLKKQCDKQYQELAPSEKQCAFIDDIARKKGIKEEEAAKAKLSMKNAEEFFNQYVEKKTFTKKSNGSKFPKKKGKKPYKGR